MCCTPLGRGTFPWSPIGLFPGAPHLAPNCCRLPGNRTWIGTSAESLPCLLHSYHLSKMPLHELTVSGEGGRGGGGEGRDENPIPFTGAAGYRSSCFGAAVLSDSNCFRIFYFICILPLIEPVYNKNWNSLSQNLPMTLRAQS